MSTVSTLKCGCSIDGRTGEILEMCQTHKMVNNHRKDKRELHYKYPQAMFKFWKWIYLFAKDRCRDFHLEVHHNDLLCPTCKTWFSISGLEYKHSLLPEIEDNIIRVQCGQCETVSLWSPEFGPVLVRVNDKGVPI